MGEPLEREPDWRPRHPETRNQRKLRDSLATRHLAAQQHLADSHERPRRLRRDIGIFRMPMSGV